MHLLHEHAKNGDLNAIKALSQQQGFNVNAVHEGKRAVDFAAAAGHLGVLEYLIKDLQASFHNSAPEIYHVAQWALYGTDPLKIILFLISRGCDLDSTLLAKDHFLVGGVPDGPPQLTLLQYLISHIHNSDFPNKYLSVFALALRRSNDINIVWPLFNRSAIDSLIAYSKTNTQVAKLLYTEGLIRGDQHIINTLCQNFVLTLKEVLNQIGDRKFNSNQIFVSRNTRDACVKQGLLDSQLNEAITKLLLDRRELTINPDDYPKCLRNYHKPIEKPIDEIIAMLLHAREIAPSPYTLQQLQSNKGENFEQNCDFIAKNPQLYTMKSLQDFLSPDNFIQSLIEIRLYPGIVDLLCNIYFSSHVSEKDKQHCLHFLSRHEKPTEFEQAIMVSAEINYNLTTKVAEENAELKATVKTQATENAQLRELVKSNTTEIAKLQDEVAKLTVLVKSLLPPPKESTGPTFFNKLF